MAEEQKVQTQGVSTPQSAPAQLQPAKESKPPAQKAVKEPKVPKASNPAATKREKKVAKPAEDEWKFAEVFDGSGAVAGRLSTLVAKQLLSGKRIAIVNAESVIITGSPTGIVERYFNKRQMTNYSNPEHAPKWPRRPDLLYKKMISGMLPKKPSGEAALKRLRVFLGVPSQLSGAKPAKFALKEISTTFITLAELCKRLGWNHHEQLGKPSK